MTTTTKSTGLKVKTTIKAGGLSTVNHNRAGLKVRSAVKAGGTILCSNHNRRAL